MKDEGTIKFEVNKKNCKSCGICTALCPTKAITVDDEGKPVMTNETACVMCGLCEMRCPDFAIRIRREK
jgi:2-oxoglutarate ferredoxin oxidoreductase subunit delta